MKYFTARFLVIATLAFCSSYHLSWAENSLFGTWISSKQSRGRMRSIMEFNENGEVTTVHGVFLKGMFSLKDDLLTLQLEGDAEPFDMKINLTKDNLTLTDFFSYENVVLMRKQLDTRSKTSIIGDWNGEDKYKGVVSYTFTVDGQFYYRKPMPGYTVRRFIVKGDTIETTRDGEKEQMKWSIIGDKLKLIYDGKEYILLRAH